MIRLKLLFVLGAVALLANQGCSSRAKPGQLQTAAASQAATATTTTPSLRVDVYPAALPNGPFVAEVSFRDSTGALVNSSATVSVALAATTSAVGTPTSPTTARLSGTLSKAAVNGIARFTDLAIDTAGRGYALTASAAKATSGTSAFFDVTWSVSEAEAAGASTNDATSGAEALSPNVPMFGALGPGDVDSYKFHAKAGQLLTVSSHAARLDLGNWDTSLRLRLLAPDGSEVARSGVPDGNSPGIDNGIASLRIPNEGDYYLVCNADGTSFLSGNYALVMKLAEPPAGLQLETEATGASGQNDTPATAQALSPGLLFGHSDPATPSATSTGSATPGGPDYYKISITAPTRVRLEITAARNGAAYSDALWDSRLQLLDASGNALATNDNSSSLDPLIEYVLATSGTYYVRVGRADTSQSTGSSPYLLSYKTSAYTPSAEKAGNTGAATAMPIAYGTDVGVSFSAAGDHWFSFTAAAGDMVGLWIGDRTQLQGSSLSVDPASGSSAALLASDGTTELATGYAQARASEDTPNVKQAILPSAGTYYVRVRSAAAGSMAIRLALTSATTREVEPNDAAGSGSLIDGTAVFSGALGSAGDKDHFTVHAEAGQLVSISLAAAAGGGSTAWTDLGSALLPALEIRDAQGNLLSATSADRKGESNFAQSNLRPESMVEASFRAPAAGNYDLTISDADGQGGPAFTYAVRAWKNQ
ncbi:MAG TPA: PPC domain-containing protein [Myxococcales bacterium]